jgi:hypothetical protein
MTAFDRYYTALMSGHLPATVLEATAEFPLPQGTPAWDGATSASWRERATTAIFACRAVREGVDSETPLHSM